jgi:hypothetical protein
MDLKDTAQHGQFVDKSLGPYSDMPIVLRLDRDVSIVCFNDGYSALVAGYCTGVLVLLKRTIVLLYICLSEIGSCTFPVFESLGVR